MRYTRKRASALQCLDQKSTGVNTNHNIYTWKDSRLFLAGESNTFIPRHG